MNTVSLLKKRFGGKAAPAIVLSSLLLTACATTPESPSGSLDVRQKLTELQSNSEVANSARTELRDAEAAVLIAEQPLKNDQEELAKHRVYMANSMVEIARAKASTRMAESERADMSEERDAARLAARTREADRAHADAESARSAESASAARSAATEQRLQQQIDDLEAEATERGLVMTLGDVLFNTGSADLQGGAGRNLDKLVSFLKEYPERDVLIEGHTDNVGSAAFNQNLSLQRAESVRRYLTNGGVQRQRIDVAGFGLARPVAGNDSPSGRQQNRRVEVIIENQE